MVIQVYTPTSNAEEAEVEQFYKDLQDLLELTPKKDVLFIIREWNAKVGRVITHYQSKSKPHEVPFHASHNGFYPKVYKQ